MQLLKQRQQIILMKKIKKPELEIQNVVRPEPFSVGFGLQLEIAF